MMKMYFHGGYHEVILFDFWRISSIGGLIGSMIGCFILGVLYEGLKFLREFLISRDLRASSYTGVSSNPVDLSRGHIIQTALQFLQVVLSYCLMLIFMTYNVWLGLAVSLGAAMGYFMFGWKKTLLLDTGGDHCH